MHILRFGLVVRVLSAGNLRESLGRGRRLRYSLHHANLGSIGMVGFVENGQIESVDLKSSNYTYLSNEVFGGAGQPTSRNTSLPWRADEFLPSCAALSQEQLPSLRAYRKNSSKWPNATSSSRVESGTIRPVRAETRS